MKLKCHSPGIKCPRYKHHGVFRPDDETVKRLLPDLNWCANCMAYATLQLSYIRDDLLQIASLVVIKKVPRFNPTHQSGASFGTFIRPQICGTLRNEKEKELLHNKRELPYIDQGLDLYEDVDAKTNRDVGGLPEVPDLNAEFEDELVQDMSFQEILPELRQTLTEREQDVFACLRENQQNYEIAEVLKLSEARFSVLVKQVMLKLTDAGQRLGLAE